MISIMMVQWFKDTIEDIIIVNIVKARVETKEQYDIVLKHKDIDEIILSRDCFSESDLIKYFDEIYNKGKKPWVLFERISRYEELDSKNSNLRTSTDKLLSSKNLYGVIIQNLDSYAYVLRKISKASNKNLIIELNYTMNCYNSETKKIYEAIYNEKRANSNDVKLKFTAPVELNKYELADVMYDSVLVYGYIDTMVSANCLKKNISSIKKSGEVSCKDRFNFENVENSSSYIIDRHGKKLHYKTYCKYCYNKIFNVDPLYLLDIKDEIGLDRILSGNLNSNSDSSLRLDFTIENAKEVKDILSGIRPENFTRGHIKNTIK